MKLRLHVEALSAVAQLVERQATVGVGGGVQATEPDLELIHVGDVEMIPVAAPIIPWRANPNRPGRGAPPSPTDPHCPHVVLGRPGHGVFAADGWRLADLGAKHALLLAGVGWGSRPEPNVREDLAAGRLVRLKLPEVRSGAYPFQAIYRTDRPPGPAAAWLIQRFVDQVKRRPSLPREGRMSAIEV